jgi:hypothetical protein
MSMAREAPPHVSAAFPLHGMLHADAARLDALDGTIKPLPAQQLPSDSTPNVL